MIYFVMLASDEPAARRPGRLRAWGLVVIIIVIVIAIVILMTLVIVVMLMITIVRRLVMMIITIVVIIMIMMIIVKSRPWNLKHKHLEYENARSLEAGAT